MLSYHQPPAEPAAPEFVTVAEVAAAWRVSEHYVRNLIQRGELPATRVGGKLLRIRPADADALMKPA